MRHGCSGVLNLYKLRARNVSNKIDLYFTLRSLACWYNIKSSLFNEMYYRLFSIFKVFSLNILSQSTVSQYPYSIIIDIFNFYIYFFIQKKLCFPEIRSNNITKKCFFAARKQQLELPLLYRHHLIMKDNDGKKHQY